MPRHISENSLKLQMNNNILSLVDKTSNTTMSQVSLPIATNDSSGADLDQADKLKIARILNIGDTGKPFDGTSDVSWSLNEIGAADKDHDHDDKYVYLGGEINGSVMNSEPITTSNYMQAEYFWPWGNTTGVDRQPFSGINFNNRKNDVDPAINTGFSIGFNSGGNLIFTAYPKGWINGEGYNEEDSLQVLTMNNTGTTFDGNIAFSSNMGTNIGNSSNAARTIYTKWLQGPSSEDLVLCPGTPQYGYLQIQNDGYFVPTQNGGFSFGSANFKVHSIFLMNSPNVGSDVNLKRNIKYFGEPEMRTMSVDNEVTPDDVYNFFKDDLKIATYNMVPQGADYKTYEISEDEELPLVVGFIAQDVVNTKVGKMFITENDEGILSYNEGSYQSLNSLALQKALQKIERLEEEIEQLKSNK